jgi:uncharacterized protein (TIGR00661 family)
MVFIAYNRIFDSISQLVKRILIAPLNWGLGHATRMVPLIEYCKKMNHEIIIASSGAALKFLLGKFPNLEYIELPDYQVVYPDQKGNMMTKMLFQLPRIASVIEDEKKVLDSYLSENDVDAILSDNRYGIYAKNIPSVFIGHQIRILSPLAKNMVLRLHKKRIEEFSECWVLDYEGEDEILGEMSHSLELKIPMHYVGILSQFENRNITNRDKEFEICVVLSGPEPQRTILENILIDQIIDSGLDTVLIRGVNNILDRILPPEIKVVNMATADQIMDYFSKSYVVISRSGYSSIMDYMTLGLKNVCLIPTPGQPEQEYLAHKLAEKNYVISVNQNDFSLRNCLNTVSSTKGFKKSDSNSLFEDRMLSFLSTI